MLLNNSVLSQYTKVLDHGYVKLIESWGSDERIIEAARMSTNKGFLGWGEGVSICKACAGKGSRYSNSEIAELRGGDDEKQTCTVCNGRGTMPNVGDEKLLRYLWTNKHLTPFEMAGVVIEVQAPIFCFRQWHRHRTWSYNEESARYVPLPDIFYVPSVERVMRNAGSNRQAGAQKGSVELSRAAAEVFQRNLQLQCATTAEIYARDISSGVPMELARLQLPVNWYSRMRGSVNLRNLLAFLSLRLDSHAQWEMQQYAGAVADITNTLFPRSFALFMEGMK